MKIKLSILFLITQLVVVVAQPTVPNADMYITDNTVNSILVDGNYSYIGGDFIYVGPPTGHGVELTTSSTTPSSIFPKIVGGEIWDCVSDGSGGYYIAGTFTKVGSVNRNFLAHINSDGTVDNTWNPNPNSVVYALELYNNHIYVGGEFSEVGGQLRNGLAKLNNTNGDADNNWDPHTTSFPFSIHDIVIDNGSIYVGGNFNDMGGQTRNKVAKLDDINGDAILGWDPVLPGGMVRTMTIHKNHIYIGGSFTSVDSETRNRLAKINKHTGALDMDWDPNANGEVSIIVAHDEYIYFGGSFTAVGGSIRYRIARVDSAHGTFLGTWNPSASNSVDEIVIDGSYVYVGGLFNSIGAASRAYIARLNLADGLADANWIPTASYNVNRIEISGTDIFVGGNFRSLGGKKIRGLAKIDNTTGELVSDFNVGLTWGSVSTIALSGDYLYIGGSFSSSTNDYLAKVNKNTGVIDDSWDPQPNDIIRHVAIDGSSIFAAGDFTTIGGQSRNYLAKLNNSTGAADGSFDPSPNDIVNSLCVSGSNIYVGGDFTTIASQSRDYLAQLSTTNGSINLTFNPDPDWPVYCILEDATGLFVGGDFDNIGGLERNWLAKINTTDGSAVSAFTANCNNTVYSLAVDGDYLYAGGDFTTVNSENRAYITKINKTTGNLETWDPQLDWTVYAIAINNSDIYAGGSFELAANEMQDYLALFTTRALPVELVSFDAHLVNKTILLNWETATEINNFGFDVERKDGNSVEWLKIGFVEGYGTTNSPKTYSYLDTLLNQVDEVSYRLKQIDNDGTYAYSKIVTVDLSPITGIDDEEKPVVYSLSQNYPNPFNPTTTIKYGLPEDSKVRIGVFNILGEKVSQLIDSEVNAGFHQIKYDANNLSSGIYFLNMEASALNNNKEFRDVKKLILLK